MTIHQGNVEQTLFENVQVATQGVNETVPTSFQTNRQTQRTALVRQHREISQNDQTEKQGIM